VVVASLDDDGVGVGSLLAFFDVLAALDVATTLLVT